jgi:hypothetical protein
VSRLRRAASVVALAAAVPLGAQADTRSIDGRIFRPVARSPEPAPVRGIMVTLHRVGRGGGRPLDSTRTDARGRYGFRFAPPSDTTAIHFVSADYAGIVYFSSPLRGARVSGDEADLTVFDTTSAPVLIAQRGRHIVVGRADSGRRQVVEVYELSNDTSVTRVASGDSPTWDAGLPGDASQFAVGEGDFSADAVEKSGSRVVVTAPIAPGIKQLSFSYDLPVAAFPLSIPAERHTDLLEVLVEDPAAVVTGPGIGEVDPVTVEDRSLRRFVARDVEPSAVIRVDAPRPGGPGRTTYIAAVATALGAGMLLMLARSARRARKPKPAAAGPPAGWRDDPETIARRIAALDADFERANGVSDETRAAYESARADLKARLARALAAPERHS